MGAIGIKKSDDAHDRDPDWENDEIEDPAQPRQQYGRVGCGPEDVNQVEHAESADLICQVSEGTAFRVFFTDLPPDEKQGDKCAVEKIAPQQESRCPFPVHTGHADSELREKQQRSGKRLPERHREAAGDDGVMKFGSPTRSFNFSNYSYFWPPGAR